MRPTFKITDSFNIAHPMGIAQLSMFESIVYFEIDERANINDIIKLNRAKSSRRKGAHHEMGYRGITLDY